MRAILQNPSRKTSGRNGTAEGHYPLKGVLVCGVCGHKLTSMPRTERGKEPTRFYGCRKQLGGGRCGQVCVTNTAVEGYLLPIIKNIADSPATVEWAAAQDEAASDEVRAIVRDNAEDERRLAMMGDMLADGAMTRAEYTRQSARLRRRVEQRESRMASVRSASVLNGRVNEDWDAMSAAQQRQVVASVVREVVVAKLARHSSRFQPGRLTVFWAIESLARMTGNEDDPAWRAEIAADRDLSEHANVFQIGPRRGDKFVWRPEDIELVEDDSAFDLG